MKTVYKSRHEIRGYETFYVLEIDHDRKTYSISRIGKKAYKEIDAIPVVFGKYLYAQEAARLDGYRSR